MAHNMSSEELTAYRDVFALFDKDKSGDITAEELGTVMRSLGINASASELQDMVNEVDTDKNGKISFDEFLALMSIKAKDQDTEQELRNAFNVFDKDGSGTISAEELRLVLKTLKTPGEKDVDDDEINDMIKQADVNGDGTIDFEEFRKIMTES
ncbi:hypothetical protein P8C59_005935 [Phyllachora maydis]|uniref:Calmodulin n=1 Tax=Phyllachora maydis TaxID=1825666 RepID=A0AAD9MC07_9PEZI|nr:hypothetical protein P8C59_005935 [Phyllachora maydis]